MSENSTLSEFINSYFSYHEEVLKNLSEEDVEKVVSRIEEARFKRQRVFVCGDGASTITVNDFAAKLHKRAKAPGKPFIDVESLCGNTLELSIWADEVAPEHVFVGMMERKIEEGHVLIALSGSGNTKAS